MERSPQPTKQKKVLIDCVCVCVCACAHREREVKGIISGRWVIDFFLFTRKESFFVYCIV